jgi:hypothetical protein
MGLLGLVVAVWATYAALAWRPQRWQASRLHIPRAGASLDGPDSVPPRLTPAATSGGTVAAHASAAEFRARKLQLRARNLAVLSALADRAEAVLSSTGLHSTPEYLRTFQHVALSIHSSDVERGDPLFRHRPLLSRLPEYTRLTVFVPDDLVPATRASLAEMHLDGRAQVASVPRWKVVEHGIPVFHDTTTWAQDLFDIVSGDDGIERVILPVSHNQIEDLAQPDNDYVEALAEPGRREVLRLPVFFRNGNVLYAESGAGRTLLVGSKEVEYQRSDTSSSSMFLPPDDGFLTLLDAAYGAERHVVLPNTKVLFHIDMAVVLLPRGAAGVIDPVDPEALAPEDQRALETIRSTLRALGLRIVPIPTTTEWMGQFQSAVNVLPFTDRRDGRLRVFVPTYPEPVALGPRALGLNDRVRAAYEAEGFEVLSVEDRFRAKHGDLHCAFNVLE